MSRRRQGRSVSRVVHYQVVVAPGKRVYDRSRGRYEDNESRCEALLAAALLAGVVTQWDGSRGFFWWNGAPGADLRALRDAIDGEPVRGDDIQAAARAVGNRPIAP